MRPKDTCSALLVILASLFAIVSGAQAGEPILVGKLLAFDADAQDRFGTSTAVLGDYAMVGATNDFNDEAFQTGTVYLFLRSDSAWTHQGKLSPSEQEDGQLFGVSVAMDGDTAVIGASRNGQLGTDAGAAYVFVRSGATWSEQAMLFAADGAEADNFGSSVAIQGDTLAIGAWGNNNENGGNAGAVYIFTRTAGVWSQRAKLLSEDGSAGDRMGTSVALDGGTLVTGADWDAVNGFRSGSAYVFTGSGQSWSQQAKLLASDGDEFEHFGLRVAIDGNTAMIAAPGHPVTELTTGSVYVFKRTGELWSDAAKLVPSDGEPGDAFGWSLAMDGGTAVIGAFVAAGTGSNTGAAYLYGRFDGIWTEQFKLFPDDGGFGDGFGRAAALDGITAIIGSPGDDDGGNNAGSAYAFRVPPGQEEVPAVGGMASVLLLVAVLSSGAWLQSDRRRKQGRVTNDQ